MIGALRANLGMNSAQFQRGARQARGSFDKLRRSMKLVAGAAAAISTAMVRSGLQTIDSQAKLAQSLNTSVRSVQILDRAAALAGVSMGEASEGAARLTRRLSLAAQGAGPAVKAFERLQIDLGALSEMDLVDRLIEINRAIDEMIPPLEQAAIRSQVFGDRAFVAFARLDTATLRQATEDLEAFGVIVSDQDADQIERTNDALSRLGLLWRGMANQLTAALAPALAGAANALASVTRIGSPVNTVMRTLIENLQRAASIAVSFGVFLGGRWVFFTAKAALAVKGLSVSLVVLRGALLRTGIGVLIVGAGELVYQFSRLTRGAGGFGKALEVLGAAASGVFHGIASSADALPIAMESVWVRIKAGFVHMLADLQREWALFLHAVADEMRSTPGLVRAGEALAHRAIRAGSKEGEFRSRSDALKDEADELGASARDQLREGWEDVRATVGQLVEAIRLGDEETDGMADTAKRLNDAMDEISETIQTGGGRAPGGISGQLKEVENSLVETSRAAEMLQSSMAQTFANIVTGSQNASDAVGQLLDQLARAAAQAGANKIIGSLGGPVFDFFAGFFAKGGYLGAGKWGIAGENGPEPIVGPAHILPSGSLMAPAPVHIGINVDARGAVDGVATQVRREMQRLTPDLKRLAVEAQMEARARGRF